MDTMTLSDEQRQLVEAELTVGERIRWLGQPVPRRTFPWAALPVVIFAVPWTLFALFWMAAASGLIDGFFGGPAPGNNGAGAGRFVFSMFGIPFVLAGLGMLSSPYWMRRRLRRTAAETVYVLTDRRALIFDGGYYGDGFLASMAGGVLRPRRGGTVIRSYMPDKIGPVQRVQQADGSGGLIFGEVLLATQESGQQPMVARAGFYSIPDVKGVNTMLEELMAAGRAGA